MRRGHGRAPEYYPRIRISSESRGSMPGPPRQAPRRTSRGGPPGSLELQPAGERDQFRRQSRRNLICLGPRLEIRARYGQPAARTVCHYVHARGQAIAQQERPHIASPLPLRRQHEDLEPVVEVERRFVRGWNQMRGSNGESRARACATLAPAPGGPTLLGTNALSRHPSTCTCCRSPADSSSWMRGLASPIFMRKWSARSAAVATPHARAAVRSGRLRLCVVYGDDLHLPA
jgi:hypothetical protein